MSTVSAPFLHGSSTWGESIVSFRESVGFGWTQEQFAIDSGMSRRTMQRLEKVLERKQVKARHLDLLAAGIDKAAEFRTLNREWVGAWKDHLFRQGERPPDLDQWLTRNRSGRIEKGPEKLEESPNPSQGTDSSQRPSHPVVATESALVESLRFSLETIAQARREVRPWPFILRSAEELNIQLGALEEACWRSAFPPGVPAFKNGNARSKPPGPLPPFRFKDFESIATSLHVYRETLQNLVTAYYKDEDEPDFRRLRATVQEIGGLLRTVISDRRKSVAEEFVEFDPFPWIPSAFDLVDIGDAIADENSLLETARQMGLIPLEIEEA